MPLQIEIGDEHLRYLNSLAQDELKKCIESYSIDVLEEASRLESTARSSRGQPQITSGMIDDAALLLRRGYRRPRRHLLLKISQIVAVVIGFLTGILADLELLQTPLYLLLFIIFLSIALVATTISVAVE